MAEGARLESVYTATYRGFESLSHRHHKKTALVAVFCYLVFCYLLFAQHLMRFGTAPFNPYHAS